VLQGKVAVVTGGGRGLGRSHVLELARQGAAVVVNDPGVSVDGEGGDQGPAAAVVEEVHALGGRAVADTGSVASWADAQAMVDRAVAEFGRIDVVVNNAGITRDGMITNITEQDWDAVLSVHLKGTLALTHHACAHWRAESKAGRPVAGRIVNTTSGTGLFGNVGQAAYGAAKAAIINLTVTTALEAARYGVTANAISPLAVTRMSEQAFAGADEERVQQLDPGSASPVVAWLASDDSSWLTGQVLRIDGGILRRMNGWQASPRHYVAPGGGLLCSDEIGRAARLLWGVVPEGLTPRLQP
jgi:NAD(P)-dependent dehydrogenase (short-subunit alcohol dehydrogenase family)